MNREIKFRAKNVNNGKWYYSYIDINPKQERSENELESRLFWQQIENGTLDIKTLGQFANLFDKNEIEICDGDIVELDTHLYLWVIKWMDGGLFYEIIDPQNCQKNERYPISTITEWSRNTGAGYDVWERDSKREIEIIGNIYENPELLDPLVGHSVDNLMVDEPPLEEKKGK